MISLTFLIIYTQGGYRELKTYLVRSHGCRLQLDALKDAKMPKVLEALNFLGKVKWSLNQEVSAGTSLPSGITSTRRRKDNISHQSLYLLTHSFLTLQVYDVIKEAWDKKLSIAELPSQVDMEVPPQPDFDEVSQVVFD